MASSRRKGIIAVIVSCLLVLIGISIFLIYNARTVSIRFDTGGNGPNIQSIVLKVGDVPERPADPVHSDPGYYFGGWYIDENYEIEYDWDMPVERNTTVYVKWVERTFSVNFLRKTNGGYYEVLYRSPGKYNSEINLPTEDTATDYEDLGPVYNFQRTNYDFLGFTYEQNVEGDYSVDLLPGANFTIPNHETSLFAVFRGKESVFQFDSNNASGMVGDQTGHLNEYFIVPSSEGLTYKYYTFVEWNTEPDGSGDSYLPGSKIKVTSLEPITLYAIWERNRVNVLIDAMGGTGSIGVNNDNLVDAGSNFDLSAITQPTRDGYRLISYNSQPDGLGVTYALDEVIAIEEENITLYSQWAKLITVSYDFNGIEGTAIDSFTGIAGESFEIEGLPDGLERPNFDFLGWDIDPDASNPTYRSGDTFTITSQDTRDVTLYAIWQGVARKLIFDNNGGGSGNTEVNSFHGRKYVIDKTAKHTDNGYQFVGWNTQADGQGITYQLGSIFVIGDNLVEGNSVLYAMWAPYDFTITYYLQGGTCSFAPDTDVYVSTHEYKENVTLLHSSTTIYRTDDQGNTYRFMGWGLSSNSSEPEYYDVEGGEGWNISMPARGLILFALWEREYTISFDPNGGNGAIEPISNIILGETFTLPESAAGFQGNIGFSRDKYTLISWSNAATNGVEYALGQTVTFENASNTTIYAVWQGNTRHIYVYDNLDNSQWVVDITGRYGERMNIEYDIQISHTDPGYELAGFTNTPVGTTIIYNYGDSIRAPEDESINIYALWQKKTFTITYDLNGGLYDGSEDMSEYNTSALYQDEVTVPALTPTREKYTFLGWYENIDGTGTAYLPNSTFEVPSKNLTLYAIWARSYTLTYDGNGGTTVDDVPVFTKGKGETEIILGNPNDYFEFTRANYEFVEWNTRADGLGTAYRANSSFIYNSDTILYAVWQGVSVPLRLNTGSSTDITIAPTPRFGDVVDLSQRIISPPRNGLELAGWADEDDPNTVVWTTEYTVDTIDRNVLYAVWRPITYKLIIRLNGGMFENSYEDIKLDIQFEQELDLTYYSNGIKQTGYKLTGYTKTQNSALVDYKTDDTFVMPASNTTIYCHWEKLAVITFDYNYSGTQTIEVKECTINETFIIPTLTRQYYRFLGWSRSQTATGADAGMTGGAIYTVTSIADFTYYAVWEGDARTITLDANGAEGAHGQTILSVKYGDHIDLSPYVLTRTNTGYEFSGWSTTDGEDNISNMIIGDYIVESVSSEITLYAVWAKRNFTIRFIDNGKQIKSITRQYDSTVDLSTSDYQLTKTGYNFLGWSENDLATVPEYTTTFTIPNRDTNLYAIWEALEVNVVFQNDRSMYPGVVLVGETAQNNSFKIVGLLNLTITLPSNYLEPGNGMYYPVYKFTGWKLLQEDGSLSDRLYKEGETFTVYQREDILMYAQWEINYITVVIDANGGAIMSDGEEIGSTKVVSVKENDKLTLPTADEVVYDGYRLLYFTDKSGNQYLASTLDKPSEVTITTSLVENEAVQLTAQWVRQYKVTFSINVPNSEVQAGTATGTMEPVWVDSGDLYIIPSSNFTRENYHFKTWNLNSLGTDQDRVVGQSYQINSNITLYVVWEGDERTLTFDFNSNKNDGTSDTKTIDTNFGEVIDLVEHQDYTHFSAGMKLAGWKFDKDGTRIDYRPTSTYIVAGTTDSPNITLYAHWSEANFELTYDANGGEFLDQTTTRTSQPTYNSTITISNDTNEKPNNPTSNPQAYSFVGWSLTKTISYTATKSDTLPTTPAALDPNIIYTPDIGDNKCHSFLMSDRNVVLYAVWQPLNWTIQYTSDGVQQGQTQSGLYGETIQLRSGVTKEDHLFKAWVHKNQDGSETRYSEGEMFKIDFANMTENEKSTRIVVFAAEWTPQSVRVRILSNGGLFKDGSEQKTYDTFVGRQFTFPKVQETDVNNQLYRVNYALVAFSSEQDGSGALYVNPGATYTIPSLTSPLIDGGELIVFAIWNQAEAYIYKSDDETENIYYATLKDAVADASDNDMIYIIKDCSVDSTISVTRSITLMNEGNYTITRAKDFKGEMISITQSGNLIAGDSTGYGAYTLTFNGNSRNVTEAGAIFSVLGTLRLYSGITITNANGINGGAIYVNAAAANVTLQYCEINANTARNGGAIYIEQGTVTIGESVQIISNKATNNGGAIYNKGTLTIGDDMIGNTISIYDNIAEGVGSQDVGNGGAIYNESVLNVNYISMQNNSATSYGGAIYNKTGGITTIVALTFNSNKANSGGAVYNAAAASSYANMTITDSVFGEEETSGNSAISYGGAVYNLGNLEITGSTFTYNLASSQSANGGAVSNGSTGTLKVNDCTFTYNSASSGYGGALSVTGGEVTIGTMGDNDSLVTFNENSTESGGGLAVYTTGGVLNLNMVEMYDHHYDFNQTGYSYKESANGGVLYISGGTVNVNGLTIHDNSTNYNGGAFNISAGTVNFNNAEIYSNTATNGGALVVKNSATVNITNANIYDNHAVAIDMDSTTQGLGGAIYNASTRLSLLGGVIGKEDYPNQATNGGAIYATAEIALNGVEFYYNEATANGGAIYTEANLNIISAKFYNNYAILDGGAIYTTGRSVVKFQDASLGANQASIFNGNTAGGNGQGIFAVNSVEIQGYISFLIRTDEVDDIYLNNLDEDGNILDVYVLYKARLYDKTRINITSKNEQIGVKLADMGTSSRAKSDLSKFMYCGNAGGVRAQNQYIINGDFSATIGEGDTIAYFSSLRLAYLEAVNMGGNVTITIHRDIDLYEDLRTDATLEASSGDTPFEISTNIRLVSGGAYSIRRSSMTGNMFQVTGGATLTLGPDSADGSTLSIDGGIDPDGATIGEIYKSIIKVDAGSKLFIRDSITLANNNADKGGAIYNDGILELYAGSLIQDNYAQGDGTESDLGLGGAIYNSGTVTLYAGTIQRNTSNGYGGGIYQQAGKISLSGEDLQIKSNITNIGGGGIYSAGGEVEFKKGTITENKTISRTNITATDYAYGGGGIGITGGTVLTLSGTQSDINITKNNSATNGGGVAVFNGTFNFTNGNISENIAVLYGGGIYMVKLNDTDNHVYTSSSSSNSLTNNSANYGGGMALLGITLEISGTTYFTPKGNIATANGGGLYVSNSTNQYTSTVTFNSSYITIGASGESNSANYGGGVYVESGSTLNIKKMSSSGISFNNADNDGGGIFNKGILNIGQSGSTTTYYKYNTASNGGAIYIGTESTAIINYATFQNNTAESTSGGGGALYNQGALTLNPNGSGNIVFGNATGTANIAYNGGAILNDGALTITSYQTNPDSPTAYSGSVTISYNRATDYGAGIYNKSGDLTVFSATLSINNNEQSNSQTAQGGGGGIAISDGSITAITQFASGTSQYTSNAYGKSYINISSNIASGYGAGIVILGGSVEINDVIITSNRSSTSGGGIALISGELTFKESVGYYNHVRIYNNTASIQGSGMFLNTTITTYQDLGKTNSTGSNFNDVIYLNNTRSYIIFGMKDNVSYGITKSTGISVQPHDGALVDGRRLAKFEFSSGVDDEGEEIQINNAEKYYTKFNVNLSNNPNNYSVNFDDAGYVVLSEPVAKNWTRNKYYATLAAAALDAPEGSEDYIEILKSHTITSRIIIENKGMVFVQKTDIVLTRSKNINSVLFLIVNTTNTSRTVYFNYKNTNAYGQSFGDGTTLTIDGNGEYFKNANDYGASLIYTTGNPDAINATGGVSGSVYAYNASGAKFHMPARTNVRIYNANLINNNVRREGGAINFNGYNGDGTINVYPSELTLENVTFDRNSTLSTSGSGTSSSYSGANSNGGAIHAEGGRLTIKNCTFTNNRSMGNGGAIFAIGQMYLSGGTNSNAINITNTTFNGNSAKYHGGALFIMPIYNCMDIGTDSTSDTANNAVDFINNTAEGGNGGAVYYRPITPQSFDTYRNYLSNISGDSGTYTATITDQTGLYREYEYRIKQGITTYRSFVSEYNNKLMVPMLYLHRTARFDGNIASSSGGAIYSTNGLYITGSNISNNTATSGSGGGVYSNYVTHIASGAIFDNNTAKSSGGSIYIANNGAYIPFETVYANYQHSSSYSASTVYENYKLNKMVRINNITVTNSSATNGGGIYADCSIAVENNTRIESNRATGDGGGIYFNKLKKVIRDSYINNNSAGNYGGGMYNNTGGGNTTPTILWNCTFEGNEAVQRGGAIYCYDSATLYNCRVSDNRITGYGSRSGGAGIWSYWRVELYGNTELLNNEITATSKGTDSGGAGVWIFSDYIYVNNMYRDMSKTYANTLPSTFVTQLSGDPNLYSTISFGYFNWTRTPSSAGNVNNASSSYWIPKSLNSSDMVYGGKEYQNVATNNVRIAGNTCNGQGTGDGIYYWGRGGYSFHLAGSPNISDDIYIKTTSCGIFIDTALHSDQNREFNIYYGSNSTTANGVVGINKNVPFGNNHLSMFRVSYPTGVSLNLSGTNTSTFRYLSFKAETITFRVYDNSYAYDFANNTVATSNGAYKLVNPSNTNIPSWFESSVTSGAYMNDLPNQHDMLVTAIPGQSLKTIYDQINVQKPGATFAYFYIYSTGTSKPDGTIYTRWTLSNKIPTRAELTSWNINTSGSEICLFIMWKNDTINITVQKLLDNKNARNSYRASDSQSNYTVAGKNDYVYSIYSNQTLEDIYNSMMTENDINNFTDPITGQVVKRAYYEGYTFSHMSLAVDKRTYKATDRYPYTTNGTLYFVFYKTEYVLTYNIGTEGTIEVEGVNYAVGGGNWVTEQTTEEGVVINTRTQTVLHGSSISLLSGSLISREGYKLYGWYNEADNTIYSISRAYQVKKNLDLIPVWEPVPYTARVYLNYPSGGSSFRNFTIGGNQNMLEALAGFSASIEGYTLYGFSYEAYPALYLNSDNRVTVSGDNSTPVLLTADDKMPSNDVILYACWLADKVTITYLNADYSPFGTQEVNFGIEFQLMTADGEGKKIWQNSGSGLSYAFGATYVVETKAASYLRFIRVA